MIPQDLKEMPVVCFGVYDTGKPRTRQMLAALRHAGFDVIEVHADLWSHIEDKTRTTRWQRIGLLLRWMAIYPGLILRYLLTPRHRIVVVGYPGIVDMLIVRPLARLRGATLVFDAFLSVYDTAVLDRALLKPDGIAARLLFLCEKHACRAADLLILDTKGHADYVGELYGVPADKRAAVPVGAEAGAFSCRPPRSKRDSTINVLFFGQFIPLHGVETIVSAARLARDRGDEIDWVLIGTGQTARRIDDDLARDPVPRLTRFDWVLYERLAAFVDDADVGLGIFGTTGKASRVVPNKVFQLVASGRPVVTRDSPAMREFVGNFTAGIRLVPPGDAAQLLAAIKDVADRGERPDPGLAATFGLDRLARDYAALLQRSVQD